MLRDLMRESSTAELLRDEGKREATHEIVRTVLEGRFGELGPEELAALQAADEPALRALAAHVATDSREQVRARLGLT